jgi:hypothetical protein
MDDVEKDLRILGMINWKKKSERAGWPEKVLFAGQSPKSVALPIIIIIIIIIIIN